MESELKRYMPKQVRDALGDLPTWHSNLREITNGVNRPGKTAKERAKRQSRESDE